jgi:hypothetical protein
MTPYNTLLFVAGVGVYFGMLAHFADLIAPIWDEKDVERNAPFDDDVSDTRG